ncbi:MAG: TolC family protein, partial [Candidatus Eremiobacteraeota bacterium]|nr:TolC family protein [Candidatus Eremiobacteraeota bacterium]
MSHIATRVSVLSLLVAMVGLALPAPAHATTQDLIAPRVAKAGVPTKVTLVQAVAIAVAQSPTLAQARATYAQALAKFDVAKSAVFPSISGSAAATRTFSSGTIGGVGGGLGTPNGIYNSVNYGLKLSELIYDGGRVIAGIHVAKSGQVAGRDTLIRSLQQLGYTVAQAYYGVLLADRTVSVDEQIVKQYLTQERLVRAQIRVGAAAPSDLYSARALTAQARLQRVTDQGSRIAAQATFATTLGLDANALIEPIDNTASSLTAPAAKFTVLPYDRALKRALLMRPDYLAALNNYQAAKENVRFNRLTKFPSVNANASDGYQSGLNGIPVQTKSLGATLTVPIFDQGLTNYNVAVAAAQADAAKAGITLSRLQVESDVRSAIAKVAAAQAALDQAQASLKAAQVGYDAASAQYKA